MLTRPQMTRNCLFRFMQVPLQFNNLEHNGICQQSEGRMHGNKHGCFLVLSNALKFALLDIFFCLELDFLGCWNYCRPCTGVLFIPADNCIVSPEFNKLYFDRMKTSNLAWNEHSLCLFSFYCYFLSKCQSFWNNKLHRTSHVICHPLCGNTAKVIFLWPSFIW